MEALTWEELVALDLCECGVPVADHPWQPKRAKPLSSPWPQSQRFRGLVGDERSGQASRPRLPGEQPGGDHWRRGLALRRHPRTPVYVP